jgi:hypothetical protein
MDLFDHQKKIIAEDPRKKGIFLGTGSGKTRTVIMLAQGKILIVCPKQQREDRTWQREMAKMGIKKDLTVISKEDFRREWEALPRYDTVIFDEAHEGILGATPNVRFVKRQPVPKTSQLFEYADTYLKRHAPERIYLVTATPTRSPMAVWAAARLLGHTWDFYQFRDAFYIKLPIPGRNIYTARKDSFSKDRLGSAVRKIGYTGRLSDYFDVPDQTYRDIKIGLTDAQVKALKDIPLMFPDPLVGVQKEYQVENGFLIDGEDIVEYPEMISDKLMDLYEEFGLVFAIVMYTHQIERLEAFFKSKNVAVFVLTGKTENRKELMEEANRVSQGVVIAQAQITSGYELPKYPVTAFVSVSHRIVDYIQAQGRTLRANALKKNLYVHFITGEQSQARFDSLKNKEDFHLATYAKKGFGGIIHDRLPKVGKQKHTGSRSV